MSASPLEVRLREAVPPEAALTEADRALVQLLDRLAAERYRFVAPTPSTAAIVSGRRERARPGNLRDVLGWSLPFAPGDLPDYVEALLRAGDVVRPDGALLRPTVRVSTVDGRLHLHSARGTEADAVFLGPDSYRFVRLLHETLDRRPGFARALDIGAGAGVGALALAARAPLAEVAATDVNPHALRLMRINAVHAGQPLRVVEGSGVAGLTGPFDLVVANPPYIADSDGRTYRDGGEALGTAAALGWAREATGVLAPGGRMILYTGAPVVEGRDLVHAGLTELAAARGLDLAYEELDPDVFGGTLRRPEYATVERIAAVGAVLTKG
ncbi:methyltransferase [Brevundimonas sp.]|uniref:methyltransferase n=1 Tax=Brevundimonas sp. TaxID=1871086 RepID=UPI0035B47C74